MGKRLCVTLCNVPVFLGVTTPKELEAYGFFVDYRRKQYISSPPFYLNCGVFINKRQVGVAGFESKYTKPSKKQIENMPVTSLFLDTPSVGVIINNIDYSFLDKPSLLKKLAGGAKQYQTNSGLCELMFLQGGYKIIFTFEGGDNTSCVTIIKNRTTFFEWLNKLLCQT